jgi:cytochrome c oxidase subunit II
MFNRLIGLPNLASEHGSRVDSMLEFVHWFMIVLGVGWGIYLAVAFFLFRKSRNPKADYVGVTNHASSHLEIGVIVAEAVLLLGFAFPLWIERVDVNAFPAGDPSTVRVRAVGEKFFWTFHYPGPDGKFGRIDWDTVNGQNILGIDPTDPNGVDDIKSRNELVLPGGRNVIVEVSAKDVIHALHLVPLRMQHDAIPGNPATMWFKTQRKELESDIVCGQLCGTGHGVMVAKLKLVSEEKFDGFLKENAPAPVAPKVATR